MHLDGLTIFGLVSVIACLAFYALEKRSPWFVLAFAAACALSSVYGFLQGAWPFGLVEIAWTVVALRRWWSGARASEQHRQPVQRHPVQVLHDGIGVHGQFLHAAKFRRERFVNFFHLHS